MIIKLLSITIIIAICGYKIIMDFSGNIDNAVAWVIISSVIGLVVCPIIMAEYNRKEQP